MFDPQRGEIRRWRICKCVTRDAFTHSHICAKMPPLWICPATSTLVAQARTHLTKFADENDTPIFHRPKSGAVVRDARRKSGPPFFFYRLKAVRLIACGSSELRKFENIRKLGNFEN